MAVTVHSGFLSKPLSENDNRDIYGNGRNKGIVAAKKRGVRFGRPESKMSDIFKVL